MNSNPRILVADDDSFFRKMIIDMVKRSGISPNALFIEATDGQQAWDLVKDNPPTVAVIDIVMPVMDGMQLSAKLKEKYPNLPILIITAHDNDLNKQTLINDIKVDGYLLKETDMAGFVHQLIRLNSFGRL